MTEETLFAAALAAADPAAFLAAHCPDPALRARVAGLLAAHHAAGSFLAGPDVTTALPPAGADPGATQTQAPTDPDATADPRVGPAGGDEVLAFLKPSARPGALGRIDHYDVLEVVGSGGFGTVMKAFDARLHRVVAVKVLAPQLAASGAARARFLREARTAAAVKDEHVVNVYAVSDDDAPVPYLVMEFVAGQTLQQKLDKAGPLPPKEALRVGMQAAKGLAAAHAQGLIHRDIKPANILLENGVERVKITDFGLARAADDASLSQSGVIAGTPMYMSPEQARGDALDTRSDLFSLGSVLYALCAGRPPFRAETTLAVLKRVIEDDPRPVREVNPETPRWLAEVVAKLHAKDPAHRFQTAREVAELLSGYLAELQQQGTVVSKVAAPRPARRVRTGTGWRWWFAVPLALAAQLSAAAALPEPTGPDDMSRRDTLFALAYGFGFVAGVGLLAAALLTAVSRRWAVRLGAATAAVAVAAAVNGGLGALADERGEVVVLPSPGLDAVLPQRDGIPVGTWVGVKNGYTLRLPPGYYTLEPRFAPGVAAGVCEWELTHQGRRGAEVGDWVGARTEARAPEFDLRPGSRVTVRAKVPKAGASWGEFIDPAGDCRLSEEGGALSITVPAGSHDLNPQVGGNMNAPRVLREVAGDFEARVMVPFLAKPRAGAGARADGVSYVGAGLVVMQDGGHPFRLFRAGLSTNKDGAPFAQAEWFPPGADRGHAGQYVPDGPLHLRLRRAGGVLHPAYSADGRSWTELPPVTDLPLAAQVRVGVAAVSTVNEPVVARFEGLAVEPAGGPDGFVPLFNGRDLTGWKTHPEQPGNWSVRDGVLVGGGKAGYLFSDREYDDFHLRAEVRVNEAGNSGLLFHAEYGFNFDLARFKGRGRSPVGYEVELATPKGVGVTSIAGSVARCGPDVDVTRSRVRATWDGMTPDTWATLEVIAKGDRRTVRIDGREVLAFDEPAPFRRRGRFALQTFTPSTAVEFRKIEVKELTADPSPAPPPAVAPFTPAEAKAHQAAWAKHLGVPVEFTNDIGMTFRLIPPGEFTMGTPPADTERLLALAREHRVIDHELTHLVREGIPHPVRLTRPFYLAAHEVTRAQFRAFADATGHKTTLERNGKGGWAWTGTEWVRRPGHVWRTPGGHTAADDEPVSLVTWEDAKAFCEWLSKTDGRTYALPTEAQWEFACRAGTTGPTHAEPGRKLDEYAWTNEFVHLRAGQAPRPVGRKWPNAFGLHDMLGGAWELCADWYGDGPTRPELRTDPTGPPTGTVRVLRGGAWYRSGELCARSNARAPSLLVEGESGSDAGVGFRVAVVGDLKGTAKQSGRGTLVVENRHPTETAAASVFRIDTTKGVWELRDSVFLDGGKTWTVAVEPGEYEVRAEDGTRKLPDFNQRLTVAAGKTYPVPFWGAAAPPAPEPGWAPLFNGKDLTGLTTPQRQAWKVEKGALTANGPVSVEAAAAAGDAHHRVELMLTGSKGVTVSRTGVQVGLTTGAQPGGLLHSADGKPGATTPLPAGLLRPGEWATVELVTRGAELAVRVDGKEVGRAALAGPPPAGKVGLTVPQGTVHVRRWEVKTPAPAWQPLFDGKTLAGWKTHASQPGEWVVTDGAITCTGPQSHLFSDREFGDHRVRVEMKVNDAGDGGVILRCRRGGFTVGGSGRQPQGYEVHAAGKAGAYGTGSVFYVGPLATVKGNPVRPDEWFTLEAEARGNHLTVWVDGTEVARFADDKDRRAPGPLALQHQTPATRVFVRKVEVLELPPLGAAAQARRDLVAAKEKDLAAVKARFDAGLLTRRDVAEAEVGVIEAALDGAPGAAAVRLLGQLVEKHGVRREVVAQRVEAGAVRPETLAPIDADIARAKARLAEARKAEPPPAAAPFTAEQARAHQAAWAQHLGVPPEVTNDLGMAFRVVPAGSFRMGSTPAEVDAVLADAPDLKGAEAWIRDRVRSEAPARKVTIPEPFLLATHEVTVGQFREFVRATGYQTHAEQTGGGAVWDNAAKTWAQDAGAVWHNPKYAATESHPATFLNPADARAFCAWLGKQDGRTYALPTEEQWEFACRAGTATRWWFGDDPAGMKDRGWTVETAFGKHRPVGQPKANPFGLFDLHGNATEMATTPQGDVYERGGQANETAWRARSAWRNPVAEADRPHGRRGFRVAVVGDPAPRAWE